MQEDLRAKRKKQARSFSLPVVTSSRKEKGKERNIHRWGNRRGKREKKNP